MLREAGWNEASREQLAPNEYYIIRAGHTISVNLGPWTFQGVRLTFSFRDTGQFIGQNVDVGEMKSTDYKLYSLLLSSRNAEGVSQQRKSGHGCCERYANQMACDCLTEAQARDHNIQQNNERR